MMLACCLVASMPCSATDPGEPNGTQATDHSVAPPSPKSPRTDLLISGIYPHLTTYGVYSQNGAHYRSGHNECGIGAVVPWAGKLWMVNYAPHMPKGSEHKLYSIDSDLSKPLTIHPESVGGTPAGRMIHEESNQLLIGHHLIDEVGTVRTIQPTEMPIRVTAIARHLVDPENWVYYIDMEGSIWEANVNTRVSAGIPSDPYLMTGYDQKSVQISHDHSAPASITLEVDIDGKGLWVKYRTFEVEPGTTTRHEFKPAFSACWVRAICDTKTSSSVQFDYR